MRSGVMCATTVLAVGVMASFALIGCSASPERPTDGAFIISASTISGTWEMDLSPAQDRSYLKDLTIVPDEPQATARTFTGTVYGGSPFDNGLLDATRHHSCAFAFVSDEKGEMGGPYYWVGTYALATDRLNGRVRSLTRTFEMDWSATRKR